MPQYNSQEIEAKFILLLQKAGEEVFEGNMGCIGSTGEVVAAKVATNIKALGRIDKVDGNAVLIRTGVFSFENDATDLITISDIGSDCFISDGYTVSKTNASNTKSIAGKVFNVAEGKVWVSFK